MADSKITALTSIGTSTDPANDPLVLVDVSDTSMAATGTTKKVTLNNLLACSPTATLASATITGDLTVDTSTLKVDSTNNRVGIGTATPARPLDIVGSFQSSLGWVLTGTPAGLGAATRYIGGASTTDSWYYNGVTGGSHIWAFGESTAMTLNSTGLAIGGSAFSISRLTLVSSASNDCLFSLQKSGTARTAVVKTDGTNLYLSSDSGTTGNKISLSLTAPDSSLSIDTSGNVGVGRSPSYRFQASSGTKATTASLASVAAFTTTDSDDFGIFFRIKTDATAANRYASITAFDNGSGNGPRDLVLQDLGGNVISTLTATAPTLGVNSQMVFNLTSNTNLRISVRGTDGTTRVANITLA